MEGSILNTLAIDIYKSSIFNAKNILYKQKQQKTDIVEIFFQATQHLVCVWVSQRENAQWDFKEQEPGAFLERSILDIVDAVKVDRFKIS